MVRVRRRYRRRDLRRQENSADADSVSAISDARRAASQFRPESRKIAPRVRRCVTRLAGEPHDLRAVERLAAAVDIVEPHDVVFFDVIAGLHFDDRERRCAGVRQPVFRFSRNERRFIRLQQQLALDRKSTRLNSSH